LGHRRKKRGGWYLLWGGSFPSLRIKGGWGGKKKHQDEHSSARVRKKEEESLPMPSTVVVLYNSRWPREKKRQAIVRDPPKRKRKKKSTSSSRTDGPRCLHPQQTPQKRKRTGWGAVSPKGGKETRGSIFSERGERRPCSGPSGGKGGNHEKREGKWKLLPFQCKGHEGKKREKNPTSWSPEGRDGNASPGYQGDTERKKMRNFSAHLATVGREKRKKEGAYTGSEHK